MLSIMLENLFFKSLKLFFRLNIWLFMKMNSNRIHYLYFAYYIFTLHIFQTTGIFAHCVHLTYKTDTYSLLTCILCMCVFAYWYTLFLSHISLNSNLNDLILFSNVFILLYYHLHQTSFFYTSDHLLLQINKSINLKQVYKLN